MRLTGEQLTLKAISLLRSEGKRNEADRLEKAFKSGIPYIAFGFGDSDWEICRCLEEVCDGCVVNNQAGYIARFWFNDVYYI